MTKIVKVTLGMPEVEGYEYTGEFRKIVDGELYLNDGMVRHGRTCGQYPVLRKIDRWRSATVEDAIRALQGIRIEARFWDSALHPAEKTYGVLASFVPSFRYPWIREGVQPGCFRFCEVKE
jgi:hypothetical protein